jgi:hypothetical protein
LTDVINEDLTPEYVEDQGPGGICTVRGEADDGESEGQGCGVTRVAEWMMGAEMQLNDEHQRPERAILSGLSNFSGAQLDPSGRGEYPYRIVRTKWTV